MDAITREHEKELENKKKKMSDYTVKQRKVVGALSQTRILFWKNSLLFRRNVSGTLAEIFVALLFVLMLLLIRYFADTAHVADETNTLKSNPVLNVVDFLNVTSGRPNIIFYPNNDFVRSIVSRACQLINVSVSKFNATLNVTSKQ